MELGLPFLGIATQAISIQYLKSSREIYSLIFALLSIIIKVIMGCRIRYEVTSFKNVWLRLCMVVIYVVLLYPAINYIREQSIILKNNTTTKSAPNTKLYSTTTTIFSPTSSIIAPTTTMIDPTTKIFIPTTTTTTITPIIVSNITIPATTIIEPVITIFTPTFLTSFVQTPTIASKRKKLKQINLKL
jgi:hypothetical protein